MGVYLGIEVSIGTLSDWNTSGRDQRTTLLTYNPNKRVTSSLEEKEFIGRYVVNNTIYKESQGICNNTSKRKKEEVERRTQRPSKEKYSATSITYLYENDAVHLLQSQFLCLWGRMPFFASPEHGSTSFKAAPYKRDNKDFMHLPKKNTETSNLIGGAELAGNNRTDGTKGHKEEEKEEEITIQIKYQ